MISMTYGQKAVGLQFNPSQDPGVASIKDQFAKIIDNLDELRDQTTDEEIHRMIEIAITNAQTAQMWAVKAITWKPQ